MESRRNGPQLSLRHDDDDDTTLQTLTTTRAVATEGFMGIYTPKSVYLNFFMWLFCLLAMTS